MNHIIEQLIGGLLGMAFHVFAVKLPSYKKSCIAGNIPFTVSGYFNYDWMAIIASVTAVIIAVFVMDEAIATYNPIQKYIKFFMIFIGFTGSSVLIAWLGRATSSALSIIDKKTNTLAEMTGEPNPNVKIK